MFRTTTMRRTVAVASFAAAALLMAGAPANAAPPTTPVFDSSIDAYAASDPQTTCDATAKPGALGIRDMLLRTYPSTTDLGIVRDCGSDGVSEHEEGRAFDWGVSANNAADKARAEEFLTWLLATDKYGNLHANARRLGVMYVIWNKKIWGAYRASEGWRDYTGDNPHTDHVHISLSWAGARKQTTWWTNADQPKAWPKLEKGTSGGNVVTLQHLLNASGQSLTADGQFGAGTEAAVKSFQGAHDATADGVVGLVTWSKLLVQVKKGDRGDAVKAAQAQLVAHGYPIAVDGIFGSGTESAVKSFEQGHKFASDGVVSPLMWQLLVAGVE